MKDQKNQIIKAQHFHDLHHMDKMLILPNIWDALGASLLEDLGYPAIATASAAIAYTNGYRDGENISFSAVLQVLKKIVRQVNIPVSADIESGYARTDIELKRNIEKIIDTGIVGINFEDSDKKSNALYPIDIQCHRIAIIRKTAGEAGIPLFINARTDVYIQENEPVTQEAKFEETVKRAKAYLNAGADCIFPIVMKEKTDIQNLFSALKCPMNILTVPGIPDFKTLSEIGVARVSLGPSFLKLAIRTMKEMAGRLSNYEGLDVITGNEITNDYLKYLISNKK
jgi:2-methylisocitrate lyase-like PEP mutase family enzyme